MIAVSSTDIVLDIILLSLIVLCVLLQRSYLKLKRKHAHRRLPDPGETMGGNHDIFGKEQIDAILNNGRFGENEGTFALVALKHRLDFLYNKKERHETADFFIETQRVDRVLKIIWRFKPEAPLFYNILGFRRAGGFFPNEFDESNNGTLVIQSNNDGESTEVLTEGEAVYYTFFLKPWREGIMRHKCSPLRFQVTIPAKEETEAIKKIIERLEQQSFGPARQNVSKAVKELGLYVEFDNAIEQQTKLLAQQIEAAGYKPEEKKDKLSRLRDVVSTVRDRYQQ